MSINVEAAHGTVVKIGDGGGSEIFTAIEGIHDGPDGPSADPQVITARHHSSVSSIKRTSYVENGSVSFSIYHDPANVQHALLCTKALAGEEANFKIIETDTGAEEIHFRASIGWKWSNPVDGFRTAAITLNVSDGIVLS